MNMSPEDALRSDKNSPKVDIIRKNSFDEEEVKREGQSFVRHPSKIKKCMMYYVECTCCQDYQCEKCAHEQNMHNNKTKDKD